MPKNWKYIKKLLEREFLCEKLKGHITYDLTNGRPTLWYQQHFIMKHDEEVLLDASQPERTWDKRYRGMEISWEQRDKITKRLYEEYNLDKYTLPQQITDAIVREVIEEVDKIVSQHYGVFGVHDIIDAIGIYLHSDIETNLELAQNDFVRALAVLDRRCGKRRLEKYAACNCARLPDWLKRIYRIRFEAEGINYHKNYITEH